MGPDALRLTVGLGTALVIFGGCAGAGERLSAPNVREQVAQPSVSAPGGRLVAVVAGRGESRDLAIVSPAQRTVRRLTRYRGVQVSFPQWSPDAQTIALARGPAQFNDESGLVHVVDSTGRSARRIGRGWGPQWDSTGRFLAYERLGETWIRRVSSPNRRAVRFSGRAPTWAPDGSRLAVVRWRIRIVDGHVPLIVGSSVHIVSRHGASIRRIASTGSCEPAYQKPDWSPDGRTIAVTTMPPEPYECPGSSRPRIAVIDVASGRVQRLPFGESEVVRWSRDGRWLAYAGHQVGVGVTRPDGTGHRVLSSSSGDYPTWSPDSRWLAWIERGRVSIARVDGSARLTVPATVDPGRDDGVGLDWSRR